MDPTQNETVSTGSIVFSNNRQTTRENIFTATSTRHNLTSAAATRDYVLSHICFTINVHNASGTVSQLSYVGQDVHRIPPILARLYGKRVQALDLSYNCLTSLQELGNFPNLTELVLDNNQLGDGITLPYIQTLHTLSLNKNNLTNLDVLLTKVVHNLPNLRYLSLLGNIACPNELSDLEKDEEDYQRYRYYVLYNLPRLQFLDSRPVTAAEREEAARRGRFMRIARPTVNTLHIKTVVSLDIWGQNCIHHSLVQSGVAVTIKAPMGSVDFDMLERVLKETGLYKIKICDLMKHLIGAYT